MNTTEAATQAHVTTATICAWARRGVIVATKTGRRWSINAASLAHRIAIGALKAVRTARPVVYTVETMTAIGGRLWERNGMRRVYLNAWAAFAGLEASHYNTGSISSASWQGEGISNSQAYKLLGSIDKVWFDAADNKLHCRFGFGSSRVATRDEVWAAIVTGIRSAITAL